VVCGGGGGWGVGGGGVCCGCFVGVVGVFVGGGGGGCWFCGLVWWAGWVLILGGFWGANWDAGSLPSDGEESTSGKPSCSPARGATFVRPGCDQKRHGISCKEQGKTAGALPRREAR